MEKSFYKKHDSYFFKNKRAVALKKIESNGGNTIEKGECFTIKGKMNGGWGSGFSVESDSGKTITQVTHDYLDLISEEHLIIK